jgi:UDP-galactopyranose mutase
LAGNLDVRRLDFLSNTLELTMVITYVLIEYRSIDRATRIDELGVLAIKKDGKKFWLKKPPCHLIVETQTVYPVSFSQLTVRQKAQTGKLPLLKAW